MACGRGRGFWPRGRGTPETTQICEPLRRPGENSLKQHIQRPIIHEVNIVDDLSGQLKQLQVSDSKDTNKLSKIVDSVKTMCHTPEDLKKSVDALYNYSLESKWNAHIGSVLFQLLGDFTVDNCKFRYVMLKRLQNDYEERNSNYTQLEKFLINVTLLCEVYYHVQFANGSRLGILTSPILDYFGMLVDGGSEKEIETFVEQMSKYSKDLQLCSPEKFEELVIKIRKKIICDSSTVTSRSMLLETFEKILTEWKPLSTNVNNFYEVVSKRIITICE